jgi:hypothetical protein
VASNQDNHGALSHMTGVSKPWWDPHLPRTPRLGQTLGIWTTQLRLDTRAHNDIRCNIAVSCCINFIWSNLGFRHCREDRLNGPSKEDWEEGYRHDIHTIVLLADDNKDRLWRQEDELGADVKTHSKVCTVDYGRRYRTGKITRTIQ